MTDKHEKLVTQTIQQYKFVKLIAIGAFSRVYRAIKHNDSQQYAIKAFPKHLIEHNPQFRRMRNDQLKILKYAKSPRILKCIDQFQTSQTYLTVTPLIKEGTLQQKLQQSKQLDEKEVQPLVKQIVEAFQDLHELGAIHRDLKPVHILLNKNQVLLCGFTFCKVFHEGEPQEDNQSLGTAFYMPPELIRGDYIYGKEVDIWSLGVTIYKMLTGTFPFSGSNDDQILENIQNTKLKPLANISEKCNDFLLRCLTKNVKQRITWDKIYTHPFICKQKFLPILKEVQETSSTMMVTAMPEQFNSNPTQKKKLEEIIIVLQKDNSQKEKKLNEKLKIIKDLEIRIAELNRIYGERQEQKYQILLQKTQQIAELRKTIDQITLKQQKSCEVLQTKIKQLEFQLSRSIGIQKLMNHLNKLDNLVKINPFFTQQKETELEIIIMEKPRVLFDDKLIQKFDPQKITHILEMGLKIVNPYETLLQNQLEPSGLLSACSEFPQKSSSKIQLNNFPHQKEKSGEFKESGSDEDIDSSFQNHNPHINNQNGFMDKKQYSLIELLAQEDDPLPKNFNHLSFIREIIHEKQQDTFLIEAIGKMAPEKKVISIKLLYRKSSGTKKFNQTLRKILSNKQSLEKRKVKSPLQCETVNSVMIIIKTPKSQKYRTAKENKFAIYCLKTSESEKQESSYITTLINLQNKKVFKPNKESLNTIQGYKQMRKKILTVCFGGQEVQMSPGNDPTHIKTIFDIVGDKYFDIDKSQNFTNCDKDTIEIQEIQMFSVRLGN